AAVVVFIMEEDICCEDLGEYVVAGGGDDDKWRLGYPKTDC
ncbi:hypothetical protein A2U01_0057440, partial [Trifolium medium]|nr:hypothetical protein [Trifolium medium]